MDVSLHYLSTPEVPQRIAGTALSWRAVMVGRAGLESATNGLLNQGC